MNTEPPYPATMLAHPMDSSRLLLELLSLAAEGRTRNRSGGELSSVIALSVLRRMLSAIRFRDAATLFHARRTGLICVGIAQRLGWEERQLLTIEVAALLHDLAKINVPDHILLKPGKLTPDEAEYIAIQNRVVLGLLQACQVDDDVIEIVAQSQGSHVKKDPVGNVSLGARILGVADAFDSLTHNQPFRHAFKRAEALKILEDQAGKQFDRNVVAALQRWLESDDSRVLDDEAGAERSVQASTPITPETARDASLFCHLCNYLYVLECLYDGYYIVNVDLSFAVWSAGATDLFDRSPRAMHGQRWGRSILFAEQAAPGPDPLQVAFRTGKSFCSKLAMSKNGSPGRQISVLTFPLIDSEGVVKGVAELLCDDDQSRSARGQFRQLQFAATRDPLTGVLNRGQLEKETEKLFDEHRQANRPFSLIYMDVDHFKDINDHLSHAVGDQVLVDIARLVEDELYSAEVVGRYGGEEFIIVCPDTPLEAAMERAERLRRALQCAHISNLGDRTVTASFGVAELEAGDSLDSLRHRADQALYDSKRSGRNRTSSRRRIAKPLPSSAPPQQPEKRPTQLTLQVQFHTCLASDMLQLKLRGFVETHRAQLKEVSPEKITMQIGTAPLFGRWGSALEKQPVHLAIEIAEGQAGESVASSKRHLMTVTVQPVGRSPSAEVFEKRARRIVESLRSHCMAD